MTHLEFRGKKIAMNKNLIFNMDNFLEEFNDEAYSKHLLDKKHDYV